jgi:PAS domain-containing protein
MTLPEHIGESNAGQVRAALLSVIGRAPEALIVDMAATVSCDQAGAHAVARAYQRALVSHTEFRMVVTSGAVLRMLGMTGAGRLMPIYSSVEAALAPRPPSAGAALTTDERAGPGAGAEVALLDRDGVITWVNQAWRDFAAANGGDQAGTGRGVSYLRACADAGDDPAAQDVAAAIRAALAGDLPSPLTIEVPCHSPATERWFDVLISSRLDDRGRCAGVTVTLSLARSGPRATSAGAAAMTPGVLRDLIDALGDGIAVADEGGTLVLASRRLEEMFGWRRGYGPAPPAPRLFPAHLQAARAGFPESGFPESGFPAGRRPAPEVRRAGAGARLTGLRQDGSTFPAEISISALRTAAGRFSLMVVRDATRARGLTAAPRASHDLELLDTVITALYRAGLSLQGIAGLPGGEARQHIEAALRVLDDTIGEIRGAAFADRDR